MAAMNSARTLQQVLQQFAWPISDAPRLAAWHCQRLGQGSGFSGVELWRVWWPANSLESPGVELNSSSSGPDASTSQTDFDSVCASGPSWCLRRWPRHLADPVRLAWIHYQLELAADACPFLLLPLARRAQPWETATWRPTRLWVDQGDVWQVEPWAAGCNDYLIHPSPQKLESAMQALACLHRVWVDGQWPPSDLERNRPANLPLQTAQPGLARGHGHGPPYPTMGPSAGLQFRLQQTRHALAQAPQWIAQARQQLLRWEPQEASAAQAPAGEATEETIGDPVAWLEVVDEIQRAWTSQADDLLQELTWAIRLSLPCGPVLADVWSDHLFFQDQRLVTIIDYGALRIDSVAADLSRVLSSLCGEDATARGTALRAYEEMRPLQESESRAIGVFDRSSQLLGSMQWLRWIFVEGRFSPTGPILQRIQRQQAGQPF